MKRRRRITQWMRKASRGSLMERGSINMNDITTLLPHIKLHFNIEHPNFEDCYAYGYECATASIEEENNPYCIGTKESEYWLEGWWAGFYGEKPLYELSLDAGILTYSEEVSAANDHMFHDGIRLCLFKLFEVTGVIVASATVGYQVLDLFVA